MIGQKKLGTEKGPKKAEPIAPVSPNDEPKWGFEFLGLLSYIFIEYTRLPMMYPVLGPLQLGKLTLIAAMLGVLTSRTPQPAPGNAALKGGVIFLAVVTTISTVSAHYTVLPSGDLWNMPEQLIAFFLVARFITSRWRQKVFTFFILLLSFRVAQYGLRSYIIQRGIYDEASIIRSGVGGGGGGFMDNSADLGVALCVVFGLSFALMQASIGKKTRWCYAIFLASFGAMILICGSRGAVVGAAAIVLTAWFRSPKKKWAAPILLLFVLGVIYLMPKASKDRFESARDWENDMTARHRIYLWEAGIRMWKDYPILGVGPANFQYIRAAQYPIADRRYERLGAYVCHSAYIQVLSELGTLGAIGYIFLVFAYFRSNARVRKRVIGSGGSRQDWEYCLASGLDFAMVGFLVSGAFVSVFWYPHIWIFGGLAAGLNSSTVSLVEAPKPEVQNPDASPESGLLLSPRAGAGASSTKRSGLQLS